MLARRLALILLAALCGSLAELRAEPKSETKAEAEAEAEHHGLNPTSGMAAIEQLIGRQVQSSNRADILELVEPMRKFLKDPSTGYKLNSNDLATLRQLLAIDEHSCEAHQLDVLERNVRDADVEWFLVNGREVPLPPRWAVQQVVVRLVREHSRNCARSYLLNASSVLASMDKDNRDFIERLATRSRATCFAAAASWARVSPAAAENEPSYECVRRNPKIYTNAIIYTDEDRLLPELKRRGLKEDRATRFLIQTTGACEEFIDRTDENFELVARELKLNPGLQLDEIHKYWLMHKLCTDFVARDNADVVNLMVKTTRKFKGCSLGAKFCGLIGISKAV